MLRDDLGLAFGDLRELGFQDLRYVVMMFSSPREQQRLIGCILDQGMPERVDAVSYRTGRQNNLRSDEPLQGGTDEFARRLCNGIQEFGFELPPDHGGKLRQLSRFGAEPVEPRQQRSLQRL